MAKKKVVKKKVVKKAVAKKKVVKKVVKKKVVKQAKCVAKTKAGKACKNKAAGKSKVCSSHKKK